MSRVALGSANQGGDPLGPLAARYPDGLINQGVSAELIAARWKFDRDDLDAFAARSHERATVATEAGLFDREIVSVDITASDGAGVRHIRDETIRASTTAEGLAGLPASFVDAAVGHRFPEIAWNITPGNSSPLTDGASAALIMSDDMAGRLGFKPRARVRATTVTGSDPILMLTGVVPATHKILARAGLSIGDIDTFEVNEAFASVPLMWAKEFDADQDRLNPRGGAIALGHPLGSSGTRLLATLLHHLEDTDGTIGLQTMCEGGGLANATIIERLG